MKRLDEAFEVGETIKVIDPSVGIVLERIAPKSGYWRINKIYQFYLECEALVRVNDSMKTEKRSVCIGDLIMSGYNDRLNVPRFDRGGGNAYGNRSIYSTNA